METDARFRRRGRDLLEFEIEEGSTLRAVRECHPPLRIRFKCQSCIFSCLYPSAMYRHFLAHKRNMSMTHPEQFQPVKVLGAGSFGEVLEVKRGEERMAIKVSRVGTTRKVSRDVLRHSDERFVAVCTYHCKSSTKEYYGMKIFAGSLEKLRGLCHQSPKFALYFALQASKCVAYLHSRGCIHNDVKLENFLYQSNYEVRISDLDSVMDLNGEEFKCRENVPFDYRYGAPELLRRDYVSKYSDLWALGASLFELFCPQKLLIAGNSPNVGRICTILANDPNYIRGRIGNVQNQDFRYIFGVLLSSNPRDRKNLTEICHELSPWAQSVINSVHSDLVGELPEHQTTPDQNIQRHVLKSKADGSFCDNFYFDRNVHQNLVAERDLGGKFLKKPKIASHE